ncbi:MAG: hypothetical protein L6R41_006037 [Letrouitia leprolyta]|nr:MAG: hypothetical protein L6R41_006037 [Letrouitia leprolyta]
MLILTGHHYTPTIHNDAYPTIDPSKCSLEGQHVVITGASKGIGRVTAAAYAKAGVSTISLGARSDLSEAAKEVQKAAADAGKKAPRVHTFNLDITSRQSVEKAAEEIGKTLGAVDILVNNAGYLSKFTPIIESDPDEWWKTWDANIRGVYLMTRSFLPLLLKGSGKTILNLTSGGAHVLTRGGSAYQTTKLAILRFSEFTNAEYGDQGILAYSLHPGGVATEMAKGLPQAMQDAVISDTPELPAYTIVYLTQKRQEWLAGRYVNAKWDMDELFAKKDEIVEKDLLRVRMAVE